MSHMTAVRWQPKDIDTVRDVAVELGYSFIENRGYAKFYKGLQHECDIALRIPGTSHEAALTRDGETWRVELDSYGENGSRCKQGVGKLYEAYAERKISAVARRRGLRVNKTVNAQGQTRLQLRRAN